jgi:hypothetical protein
VKDGSRSNALFWRVEVLNENEGRSEDGEFGGFGEFSTADTGDKNFGEDKNTFGLKKTHQTHQTHHSPPWRRSTEDARQTRNKP